ncbi:MAG: hypothetical protein Kow0099_04020 [Candidatus Abyssubacteria bacterium]
MRVLVVDASVAAKWFVEEKHAEAALSVLREENQLHAPDFLLLEFDSLVWKWIRRKAVSPAEGSAVRSALRQYPIQYHSFVSYLDSAFAIADQTGQTVYDCLYVALANVIKGRMVTADRSLYNGLRRGPFGDNLLWVGDAG